MPNSKSKLMLAGSIAVFFVFLGFAQFMKIVTNIYLQQASQNDMMLICAAIVFTLFCAWAAEYQ